MIFIDFSKESSQRQSWVAEVVESICVLLEKEEEILFDRIDEFNFEKVTKECIVVLSALSDVSVELEELIRNKKITVIKELRLDQGVNDKTSLIYVEYDNSAQLKVVLAGILAKGFTSSSTLS